jgi:hypothetical protein
MVTVSIQEAQEKDGLTLSEAKSEFVVPTIIHAENAKKVRLLNYM